LISHFQQSGWRCARRIGFDEAHGDYVGVNVIATASSQSAMDANRDTLEAILHSVH